MHNRKSFRIWHKGANSRRQIRAQKRAEKINAEKNIIQSVKNIEDGEGHVFQIMGSSDQTLDSVYTIVKRNCNFTDSLVTSCNNAVPITVTESNGCAYVPNKQHQGIKAVLQEDSYPDYNSQAGVYWCNPQGIYPTNSSKCVTAELNYACGRVASINPGGLVTIIVFGILVGPLVLAGVGVLGYKGFKVVKKCIDDCRGNNLARLQSEEKANPQNGANPTVNSSVNLAHTTEFKREENNPSVLLDVQPSTINSAAVTSHSASADRSTTTQLLEIPPVSGYSMFAKTPSVLPENKLSTEINNTNHR